MTFSELIKAKIPTVTDEQAQRFETYYSLLVYWNENKCNLTAVTAPEEAIDKHFCDSLLAEPLIEKGAKCVDVGSGAGFPGVPLLIMRPDIELVMVDSLGKRVEFLNTLIKELDLKATAIHARAEDAARDDKLRGKFDVALTRAVAKTSILLEWTSPFLKVGGKSLMYKSKTAKEELSECENALKTLNLKAEIVTLDAAWGDRAVIAAAKTGKTPAAYPRKAGMAKKKPL